MSLTCASAYLHSLGGLALKQEEEEEEVTVYYMKTRRVFECAWVPKKYMYVYYESALRKKDFKIHSSSFPYLIFVILETVINVEIILRA